MPDLKDKYSDSNLDPAEQSFENLVDGGDTNSAGNNSDVTAQNLRRSEEGLGPIQKRLQRRDNKQQELRDAEAKDWNNPENGFYKPTERTQNTISRWSKRRKIGAGVGIGGGIGGILIAMFMLLPLKIPGIMQMITDEAGQRVEQITERRAKIILARAIVSKFGATQGIVITGNGAFSTLMTSMRTASFEKKLAAQGLTIERSGKGVVLKMKGKDLQITEGGRPKIVLTNEIEVVRALDGSPEGRKLLNSLVKEEIPSWRWMKRAKFAKWLRIKYGIPRYGIENSNNPDEDARVEEMQKSRLKTAYQMVGRTLDRASACVLSGGNCNVDPNTSTLEGISGDGRSTFLGEQASGAIDQTVDANATPGGVEQTLTKSIIENTAKLGAKAIPVVGWLDLLASIDHLVYETSKNELLGKLASYFRIINYSQHYANGLGQASQIQLGAMDPAFIGVLAAQTEGVEESQAFNMIEGNPERGTKVDNKINANNPGAIVGSGAFKSILGTFSGGYDTIGGKIVHEILDKWYRLANKAFEWLATVFLGVVPDALATWVSGLVSNVLGKVFEILGLDFDPATKGAAWFNAAHGGATWTQNDFCRNEMGCRKLTPAQTNAQNQSVAVERQQYNQDKGLAYSLFSSKTSASITSRLAVRTPTSGGTAVLNFGRFLANMPATFMGVMTQKTSATTAYVDIHGVDPYGATNKDINQPLSEAYLEGEDCPTVAEGDYNSCKIDTVITEAMICEFDPESVDCADTDPPTSSNADLGDMRVATYNIKVPNQTDFPGSGWANSDTRVKLASNIVKANDFDVIGFQEIDSILFQGLKANLPEFSSYPKASNDGPAAASLTPIFWRSDLFTEVKNGSYGQSWRLCKGVELCDQGPWVRLTRKDGSGGDFYAISVHLVNENPYYPGPGSSDRLGAEKREATSKAILDTISGFEKDIPVVLLGDMNSSWVPAKDDIALNGNRERLPYCIFTERNTLVNAVDAVNNLTGCPTKNLPYEIDHIYLSSNVSVSKTKQIRNEETKRASDHDPIYADISGAGTSTNAGANFRLGTYNLPTRAGESGYKKAASNIKERDIEVVGMQELVGDNYRYLQRVMKSDGYSIYPDKKPNEDLVRSAMSTQAIIFKNEKFELVKTSMMRYPRFPEDPAGRSGDEVILKGMSNAPIIWLRDKKTGQTVIVMNTHNAAYAGNADRRYKAALVYTEEITKLKAENPGIPIFFTGDFNEGTGVRREDGTNKTYEAKWQNLLYCMFAQNKLMVSTEALAAGKGTTCPNDSIGGVDYIYASKGMEAKNFTVVNDSASDHPAKYVDITVPGNGTGGWVWPMKTDVNNGPCYGGSSVHAGMDMNSSSTNTPVLAMHKGIVKTVNPTDNGAAGVYITIEASEKFRGKPVFYTYEHLRAGSIPSNIRVGKTVSSGQKVGIAGKTGNLTLTTSVAHLHIVTATTNTLGSYGSLGTTFNPMDILEDIKPAPGGYRCT